MNIGVDIIENERFAFLLEDENKLARILSNKEIKQMDQYIAYSRKLEFIASRFAGKEALFKAGIKDNYNTISIINDENGKPFVECESCNDYNILISLSHNQTQSIAFVIVTEK